MTKAEYKKRRYEHWRHVLLNNQDRILHKISDDVDAAEAAGVKWDREEELPPRHIEITPDGRGICWRNDSSFAPIGWQKVLAEVVRRYNLWPRLADIAGECARCKHDLAYLVSVKEPN